MKDFATLAQEYHGRFCEIGRLNARRRKTLACYLGWFVGWLADKAHVVRPDQLSSEVITSWYRFLSAKPCRRTGLPQQPASIYNEASVVRRFCQWMLKEGYVSAGVLLGFPAIKPPAIRQQVALRHEEARKYLQSLPMNTPDDYLFRALAEFIYSSGVRASEVLQLDLRDISLSTRLARVMGKGQKERMVPIGRAASRHLEIYMTGVRPLLLRNAAEPALWLNRVGRRLEYHSLLEHFTVRDPRPEWRKIRPHVLRRSCATELIRGGANLWAVKDILGHDDLETLESYVLLDLADLKATHVRCHPRDLPPAADNEI